MAEGRIDLTDELFSTKPGVDSGSVKDDIHGGNYEEKEPVGLPDDLKDQLTSENIIPLSPQWLYAKSSEFKPSFSALSGESRGQNSLPQGISADSNQKDGRRLDGSQDKKDWRRTVPDIESSHRWREEERETGLLGRRERRKEGERENDHKKSERRVDNVSARETSESRSVPVSDRWHEVSSRNVGHESRRDSKWSSRWGPEDKEDPRTEKKVDVGKEDSRNEKQLFVGSSRASSESDARDKWRPRHRQEVHSGGATVHRAAPGFGLDRGRPDGLPAGFAPGRGRSNLIGSSPIGMPPVSGPIGSAFVNNTEAVHRKSDLSADTFHYPRGKLLDIYRKHKTFSSFDTIPEGLEDTPSITQSNLLEPLSIVAPDAEEEAVLEGIWKGKITSSEASYNLPREKMMRVKDSETGENGMTLIGGSVEISEEISEASVNSGSYAYKKFDGVSYLEGHETTTSAFMVEAIPSGLISQDDDSCEVREPCGIVTGSDHVVDGTNGVEMLALISHLNSGNTADRELAAALDAHKKLPDDSNTVFDSPFLNDSVGMNELHQKYNEVKFEQGVPPEELSLFYQDPQGEIQGPFLGVDIISWFDQGFFGTDLPVCLSDAPEGTPFRQLGEIMPLLKLRAQPALFSNPGDKQESSNLIGHNLEESRSVSDVSTLNAVSEHKWESSEEGVVLGQSDQQGLSKYSDPFGLHVDDFPSSRPESSLGLPEKQSFHELAGPDVEEVLYCGRAVTSKPNVLLKPDADLHDRGLDSNMHDLCSSETGEASLPSHKVPANNDVHPLGLLWSELGAHPKHPLSMNLSTVIDQPHLTHPEPGNDISVLSKQQDPFSAIADSPDIRDLWLNAHNRDGGLGRNVLQDDMVSQQRSRLEQESSQLDLEDRLLLQQLQMQHLQQQKLSSPHQQPYLEQLQGPRHQQSVNQPMPELEHLLKFGFPQQRLLQLQLQHQQQQLLHHHPMRLLQQQQQQRQQSHVQQLLLEQLLQQHMHDPSVGRSRADPLHRNNMLDDVLIREHLLRDLQQQSLQLRHHEPSLEHLIQAKFGHGLHLDHQRENLELLSHPKQSQILRDQQLFLSIQQDQHQTQQFPGGSRHFPVMEEERHAGRPWSVNESGQLVRKSAGQHWSQSSGPNPLDRLQSHQRHSTFEQPSHFDHNLTLHEHVQHGLYEPRSQAFDRPLHSPAAVPALNMELMSRLQGLEMQDQFGRVNSLGQMGQFSSSVHSHQQQIPNQFRTPRVDALDTHWSEPVGQLPSNSVESQFLQRQRSNLKMNLEPEDSNAWATSGNDEKSKQALRDMLHKNLNMNSLQTLEMVDKNPDSSFGIRGAAWPFPGPASEHPLSVPVDQTGWDTFAEDACEPNMGLVVQEELVNVGADGQGNNVEGGKGLSYPTVSGALMESEHFFSSVNGTQHNMFTDSITDSSLSREKMNLLEAKEGEKRKLHDSKGENKGLCNIEMEFKDGPREEMISDRVPGLFLPDGSKSSLPKRPQGSKSSQEALVDLTVVPVFRSGDRNASSSEEGRQGARGGMSSQVPEIPSARKDMNFCRTSSSDGDVLGPSFIDMVRSTKKPTPEADSSVGGLDAEGGQGSKGGKKKGKKGRQIDPSLLGFKVHSNRIMMGEIQRPDD